MPLDVTKGSISLDYAEKVAAGALAEDVEGDTKGTVTMTGSSTLWQYSGWSMPALGEIVLVSKTLTFDANSLAFCAAFACVREQVSTRPQFLRLYMGGVLMQEIAVDHNSSLNYLLRDFKAMSGEQTCELKDYNDWDGVGNFLECYGYDVDSETPVAIAVGSVKLA